MILADVEWKKETKILSLIDTWMMDSFLRWTARKEVTDYLNSKEFTSSDIPGTVGVQGLPRNVSLAQSLIIGYFSAGKENVIRKSKKEVSLYFTFEPSDPSIEWACPHSKF